MKKGEEDYENEKIKRSKFFEIMAKKDEEID